MRDRDPAFRPPSASRLRRLAPAALILLLSACAVFGGQSGEEDSPAAERDEIIRVQATNLAWASIHVYAISGGSWQSLGILASQDDETWDLSVSLVGNRREIRLVADPVGSSDAFISEPVLVEPGDLVMWTIQNNLALSSVSVR